MKFVAIPVVAFVLSFITFTFCESPLIIFIMGVLCGAINAGIVLFAM